MGILLSWQNLADAGTTTASSEAGSLGVRALKTPQISDVWRSGSWGTSTVNLRSDLGASRLVQFVGIAAPRDSVLPTPTATVRLTASTSTADGTDALDTGTVALGSVMAAYGLWTWSNAAGVTARYWRLQFTGTAADAYIQLGRLWIGPALITTRAASYGHTASAADPGSTSRAGISGVRDVQRGRAYRLVQFAVATLTTAEAAQVEAAALAAGATGQVFGARLASDPASTGLFGVFAQPPSTRRVNPALYAADFSLAEDL